IDVIGSQHRARKLLKQVGFFIGKPVAADDAHALAAAGVAKFAEALADVVEGFIPADRLEFPVGLADEWMGDAVVVVGKVEGVAALVAEEVAVDAALVAVVAPDDLTAVGGRAHAEGRLAAIA